VVTRLL